MARLAWAYQEAGKLDLAVPLFEETLRLQRAKLGSDHPDTLLCMARLAWAYQEARKRDLAVPLYEEAFKSQKRSSARITFTRSSEAERRGGISTPSPSCVKPGKMAGCGCRSLEDD